MQTESIAFMHDGTASDVLPRLWRKCLQLLLFVLLYIDSRAWFTKGNFVDPTGGQEAFLAILVLFFLFAVLPKVLLKQKIDVNGLFVLVVIAFVLLVSPIGAWLTYGQPIYAGMIEERRVLSFLIFFPVFVAIRSKLVTSRTVLSYVTVSAVLCLLNAAAYYSKASAIEVAQNFTSEAEARADRAPIGTGFVLIGTCYVLSRYVERPKLRWALLWLAFVFDVIVFDQGRQTIIAVAIASILLMWGQGKALRHAAVTCMVGLAAILPFTWKSVLAMWEKYIFLFTLLSNAHNLRVDTIHSVMNTNLLVPHGALWAQWNEGFANIFGPNFFLADIGIFGELFRYGAVLLCVLLLGFYGYIYHLIRSLHWNVITRACTAFFLITMIIHVFQPVVEHGGFDVGIILAVLANEPLRKPYRLEPSVSPGG